MKSYVASMSAFFLCCGICWSLPASGVTAAMPPALQRLHNNARDFEKKGNLKRAIEIEREATRRFPAQYIPQAYLAYLYWRVQETDRAILEARKAVRLAAGDFRSHMNLASMLHATGEVKEAIKEYEQALAIDQSQSSARLGLAQALAIDGRLRECLEQLTKVESKASDDFGTWLRLGETYLALDRHGKAQGCLERALRKEPSSERAAELLLLSALGARDYKLASSLQERVLRASPTHQCVYAECLRLLPENDAPKNASFVLDCAGKSMASRPDVFFDLSRIFLERALLSYDHASTDSKARKDRWLQLAESSIKRALDVVPGDQRYRWIMAGVLYSQGRFDDASQELSRLAKADHGNFLAPYCLARVRSYRNDVARQAKMALTSFIRRRPDLARTDGETTRSDDELFLTCARFSFAKLKCCCHVPVLEHKWRKTPGVVYARIPNVNAPTGVVLYTGSEKTISNLEKAAAGLAERMTR
ncbi:MAG TPA: tetratricopeptide repeat protein, partial [Candidatus Obscuribacterales bacterium]